MAEMIHKKIKVKQSVQWSRDVDRMLVFSSETGEFIELDMVGARIIELANGKRTIQDIASMIQEEFRDCPDPVKTTQEIATFVDLCVGRGILDVEE